MSLLKILHLQDIQYILHLWVFVCFGHYCLSNQRGRVFTVTWTLTDRHGQNHRHRHIHRGRDWERDKDRGRERDTDKTRYSYRQKERHGNVKGQRTIQRRVDKDIQYSSSLDLCLFWTLFSL